MRVFLSAPTYPPTSPEFYLGPGAIENSDKISINAYGPTKSLAGVSEFLVASASRYAEVFSAIFPSFLEKFVIFLTIV